MKRCIGVIPALVGAAIVAGVLMGNAPVRAQSGGSGDRSQLLPPSLVRVKGKTKASGKSEIRKPATPAPAVHLVAYDAHDRRYYSLQWAKKNGMRDPSGDPLVILPLEKLPKGTNPAIAPSSLWFAKPRLFSAPSQH